MKKALRISAGVLVVLLALVLVLPAFVDVGAFKSSYLPFLEETLERRIDVGEVRLRLLPRPSIRISNLKVSDGPASSDGNFFAAEQVQMRLKFWPLVLGRFDITDLVLDKPVMRLSRTSDNAIAHADAVNKRLDSVDKKIPAAKKPERKKQLAAPKASEAFGIPFLVPGRMRIKDGKVNLAPQGQSPVEINGIDLSLHAAQPLSHGRTAVQDDRSLGHGRAFKRLRRAAAPLG